jgi:hypothetical protein
MGSKDAAMRPAIFRVRMPDGVAAMTDGVNIYADDRLNEIQLKCAILHEEIHIERGHGTHQVEAVEMAVRYETAKRMLPDLAEGCGSGKTLAAAARDLEVTRQVLMDRAATFNDAEAISAGCLSCLKCPAIAARFASQAFTVAA